MMRTTIADLDEESQGFCDFLRHVPVRAGAATLELSRGALVAMAGRGLAAIAPTLKTLTRVGLLTVVEPGRYRVELGSSAWDGQVGGAKATVNAPVRRLIEYYLRESDRAAQAMNPRQHQYPLRPGLALGAMASAIQAHEWFELEMNNLVAAIRNAYDRAWDGLVLALGDRLWSGLCATKSLVDIVTVQRWAWDVADRQGLTSEKVVTASRRACGLVYVGDREQALRWARVARENAQRPPTAAEAALRGDPGYVDVRRQTQALAVLGLTLVGIKELDEALATAAASESIVKG